MRRDVRRLASLLAVILAAGGCVGESSLDFGTPVNMHVWTTPTSVEVDAPGWLTDVSSAYLCFEQPPRLPADNASREGWTPGEACQDVGTFQTSDGLKTSIPLERLDPGRRAAFDAAADWYLLLVALDGNRASSAISSRFHAPTSAAAP
jgi:hypothetical protein